MDYFVERVHKTVESIEPNKCHHGKKIKDLTIATKQLLQTLTKMENSDREPYLRAVTLPDKIRISDQLISSYNGNVPKNMHRFYPQSKKQVHV